MLVVMGVPNLVILAVVAALLAGVTWSRTSGRNPIGRISWPDAWLKAIVIVVLAICFVAFLPSWILQSSAVAKQDRILQDLIGTAIWGVALGAFLIGLRLAHRAKRV